MSGAAEFIILHARFLDRKGGFRGSCVPEFHTPIVSDEGMGYERGRGDRKNELKIITKEILNIINYWESLIIMGHTRVVLEGYYKRVA